ncbi:HAMP domain-containing sensor histidine kinase [Sphingomonas sp.]|uniref:sensor histidine kinase n=1 Tax=Sphingomonas sp. TaxID=28214 RepID=UPI001D443CF4|nr:HAMP domain-containing sensor histidine kinase [Sphingomonas sp.]MBX9797741.1 HAMP domain-containing histidine kinase [Sphingomonas sp.]
MRFNDSLETVLAADLSTGFGAQLAWRQIVDLVGRGRAPVSDKVIATLRAIRPRVAPAIRAASVRSLGGAQPPAALVGLLAEEPGNVAAPLLRSARLTDAEWIALMPRLSPQARAVLRHRRDLNGAVRRALASYGPVDFVLPASEEAQAAARAAVAAQVKALKPADWRSLLNDLESEAAEPALQAAPMPVAVPDAPLEEVLAEVPPVPAPEPGFAPIAQVAATLPVMQQALQQQAAAPPEPTPTGPFEIADIVARIDAFQRQREAAPVMAAPAAAPAPLSFRFETDARGIIRWADGVERGAVIGISLEYGAGAAAAVDGVVSGAFRRRARFDSARLVITGQSDAAGDWRLSGVPVFDPSTGRFTGYRGAARRPRADERAEPGAGAARIDSLRQLVHELRTPTTAIAGFAEMIEGQMIGPVPAPYRVYAQTIIDQARALLGAIDDLDTAARIERGALELRPADVALAPLITRVLADLAPLARLRGASTELSRADSVAVRGDDRAIERLVARLLAALVSVAGAGEVLSISAGREGEEAVLRATRPRGFVITAGDELPAEAEREAETAAGAPLLGLGFAIRLVRNLARELNGSLAVDDARLTLRLPAAFAEPMGQASIN